MHMKGVYVPRLNLYLSNHQIKSAYVIPFTLASLRYKEGMCGFIDLLIGELSPELLLRNYRKEPEMELRYG
jgi:hypothetical protein